MREKLVRGRATVIAILGLVVALVACGDDGTTSQPTTTLSMAELQAKLLDVGGVGAGWQLGHAVNDADLSDATQIPCEGVTLDPAVTQRLTPVTGIQFEPTDRSYKHLIEFALTGDPKQLESDLQTYFATLEKCSTVTTTTPAAPALTINKLTVPKLGDQRAAYVITGKESPGSDTTWYGRSAAVRVGSIAIELGLTEILSATQDKPQISDDAFVKILQTAVAKLSS
jgi:hypothetical protein